MAYTKQPAGRLKRLTVAVLVDNDRAQDAEGKATEVALTPERIENMTRLVKDAVGFDSARGDSVSVVNVAFKAEVLPEQIQPDVIPLWERPLVRDIAKLVAALIVLLTLVLTVLRPLVRNLLAAPRTYVPHTTASVVTPALAGDAQVAVMDYDAQIQQARSLVAQDPARVAQVVKGWVGNDE
jgi:flagellar M-ring protein FliF